jgi:hypothetical protein
MATITLFLRPASDCAAAASVATKEELIADLSTSLAKLTQIPLLLQQSEWDKVRTILKTPPIAQLWNLGESQNTLVKLAKETGNFDLLELKDDLAISLQMTDQYSYDNVFIYYQPGEFLEYCIWCLSLFLFHFKGIRVRLLIHCDGLCGCVFSLANIKYYEMCAPCGYCREWESQNKRTIGNGK